MAIGTNTYTPSHPLYNAQLISTNITVAQQGWFDVPVKLRSVLFRSWTSNTGSVTVAPVVYSSTGVLVARGTNVTLSVQDGVYYEVVFSTPVMLSATTSYKIGMYISNSSFSYPVATAANATHTHASTPAFFNWNITQPYFSINGDSNPSAIINEELLMGLSVDQPNTIPNAPTGLSVTNSPVPLGGEINASWTHNDPNSNPQSKYQMRWRKV